MKRYLLVLGLWAAVVSPGRAQTVQAGQQLQEVFRMNEAYSQLPYLSFNVLFQYRDTLAQPVPDEQISGQYKVNQGRFWAMLDSTEMIQGYNYFITVYHGDSMITVSNPTALSNSVLQLPILDSLYRDNFVDSMSLLLTADTIRRLTVHFKPATGTTFQIFYKSTTYLIDSIKYAFPNPDTVGTNYITAKFTAYSGATVDDQYFLESKYIYKDGQSFFLKPAYSSYNLSVTGDFSQSGSSGGGF